MAGERTQLTPPYPGTSPKGRKGQIDPATGLLIPEDEGGPETPPLAPNEPFGPPNRYGYAKPQINKSFFDPDKPPPATLPDWRQASDPLTGLPLWRKDPANPKQYLVDSEGNLLPELRYMGEKPNPEVGTYKAAGLEYYKLLQNYFDKTGDAAASAELQALRNTGQLDLAALQDKNALNRQGLSETFTAGQNQLDRESRAQQAAQEHAFDWTKLQAGFGFQEHMQQANQVFQVQMQQAQQAWQGMENDKNRAIEMRRVAIEQGHLDEAVRHNQVTERLAMQQELQRAKMDNLSMIQGILKDPSVFMMMRNGGFSFAQVSPEYASLDRIPVPTVGTQQNLARWQAGSQFAQQQYLPGMAPQPEARQPQSLGPIPQQLTLGQVLPGVIPSAAGLPAFTPPPHNPEGGPQGSNQQPAGSYPLY